MKKLLIVILTLCSGMLLIPDAKAQVFEHAQTTTNESVIANSYKDVLKTWQDEGYRDDIEFHEVIAPSSFSFDVEAGSLVLDATYENFLEDNDFMDISNGEVFEFNNLSDELQTIKATVNVEQAGLYKIGFDYFAQTETISQIEVEVKVNDKLPYYEASQVVIPSLFTTPSTFTQDRYGNDIMPMSSHLRRWQQIFIRDASRLYEQGLLFQLNAGANDIEITRRSGYFKLGQIYVENFQTYIDYETYLNAYDGPYITDTQFEIEAENVAYKNDVSIRYTTDRNPTNRPFALIEARLNVLDGGTFKKSGQTIFYDLNVPKTGFYQITLKALMTKEHTKVFRTLTIDGKVPFDEAQRIGIPTMGWKNYTLNIDGQPLWFYLTQGHHTLGFEVNSAPYREIYHRVNDVMRGVNDISIDIKKLTGNQVDESRDWVISDYMPNLARDLTHYGDLIKASYDEFKQISGAKKDADIASGLKATYGWLYDLAKNPNDVPKNIDRLTGATTSVLQRLGIVLPLIIDAPLTIEKFYVHGEDAKFSRANPGFFENIWYEIRRFFASFFSTQYQISSDNEALTIWVNRSRQYVNLMQQLVDDQFTTQTGMRVDISIMPNEDKLILATSSNSQPDLALGVAGWRPYDFAIRNALVDLSTLDGFDEVTKRFKPGAFMQLIYQEGVYGLPETQNFNILFYRRDILESLQLDVPDTWTDVLDMLPELQRFGMNFYSMLSSATAFKAFSTTMPFIMQHGGSIYGPGALTANLDSEEVIQAMTLMSDLFTVYALPLEVGSFYNQFRYGNIPVGIGDFGMYIQLLHAAPEIAGLWNIAPLPGILQDGVVDRSYDGASTSAMIFKNSNKVDEAWQFLKWWMQKDIQLAYAENLMASFGPEYMWNTANVEAFAGMSIQREHKEVFLEQWNWVLDTAKTPASYMLEREISNAWNKIVYDGVNVRTAMEDAMVVVNKEIDRKMLEFGFINSQGDILRPYILPTKDNLDEWVISDD